MKLRWLLFLLLLLLSVTVTIEHRFANRNTRNRFQLTSTQDSSTRAAWIRESSEGGTYIDSVLYNLRQEIEEIEKSAYNASMLVDQFDNGTSYETNELFIFGARKRAVNVSRFCGALADRQLRHIQKAARDGIIYQPQIPITGNILNLTLEVPKAWFRETPTGLHKKQFLLFLCYEGDTQLLLVPTVATPSELISDRENYLYHTVNKFEGTWTIREIALVLDGQWNNAYLYPVHLRSKVTIRTEDVKKRNIYDKKCDPQKGGRQPCCLWPFSSRILFGPSREVKEITFHRCVGNLPNETYSWPYFDQEKSLLLQHGGMSRRFIFSSEKVCRESKFKPVTLAISERGATFTKTLHRLDATECAVYY